MPPEVAKGEGCVSGLLHFVAPTWWRQAPYNLRAPRGNAVHPRDTWRRPAERVFRGGAVKDLAIHRTCWAWSLDDLVAWCNGAFRPSLRARRGTAYGPDTCASWSAGVETNVGAGGRLCQHIRAPGSSGRRSCSLLCSPCGRISGPTCTRRMAHLGALWPSASCGIARARALIPRLTGRAAHAPLPWRWAARVARGSSGALFLRRPRC